MNPIIGILPSFILALTFPTECLDAAVPGKRTKETVPDHPSTAKPLDEKSRQRLKRAHHLAEKSANTQFLNSPLGIAFKQRLTALDDEVNAIYEKKLNLFLESPENGKKLRAERDRQLQLLSQKRGEIETDYENLKKSSPDYRAMLEKHLKEQLGQVKGKLKQESPEAGDEPLLP